MLYEGILSKGQNGFSWSFNGTGQLYDYWNFEDWNRADRELSNKALTLWGHISLELIQCGTGFSIFGPKVSLNQSSSQTATSLYSNGKGRKKGTTHGLNSGGSDNDSDNDLIGG